MSTSILLTPTPVKTISMKVHNNVGTVEVFRALRVALIILCLCLTSLVNPLSLACPLQTTLSNEDRVYSSQNYVFFVAHAGPPNFCKRFKRLDRYITWLSYYGLSQLHSTSMPSSNFEDAFCNAFNAARACFCNFDMVQRNDGYRDTALVLYITRYLKLSQIITCQLSSSNSSVKRYVDMSWYLRFVEPRYFPRRRTWTLLPVPLRDNDDLRLSHGAPGHQRRPSSSLSGDGCPIELLLGPKPRLT
jgi:hypothetical protein